MDGPTAGATVVYGDVDTQGKGDKLSLAGGASLRITVHSHSPVNARPKADLVNVTGFPTFREVAYGGSFESVTTIGLGVRARLPFGVFALNDPPGHSRLVIDVARFW